jgi:4-azaleucine resistance transporter AzlC
MISEARKEFFSGLKAELPILFGVVPFGMIYGVLALEAGLAPIEAQAMSSVVFAGSAQFISTQLIAEGAPWLVLVMTVGVVNLRHALYSASMAPYFKGLRPAWKWILAYLLTDEAYLVTIIHYEKNSEARMKHWFLLGAGLGLWTSWQLSTAAGIFLGAAAPESWSLDFTLALTFIALVVPAFKERANLAAALAAGLTAVLAFGLPYKLGLIAAALFGILVGVWMDVRTRR